jgi:hypothetical protein
MVQLAPIWCHPPPVRPTGLLHGSNMVPAAPIQRTSLQYGTYSSQICLTVGTIWLPYGAKWLPYGSHRLAHSSHMANKWLPYNPHMVHSAPICYSYHLPPTWSQMAPISHLPPTWHTRFPHGQQMVHGIIHLPNGIHSFHMDPTWCQWLLHVAYGSHMAPSDSCPEPDGCHMGHMAPSHMANTQHPYGTHGPHMVHAATICCHPPPIRCQMAHSAHKALICTEHCI